MGDKPNIEDMIKALKCVASNISDGDCHADIENFKHRDDADFKSVVCTDSEKPRDLINGGEGQCCPYYQKTYGCCFEDGELYWLDDVAKLLEELKEYRNLSKQGRLLRLPCRPNDIVYRINKEVREPIIRMSVERIVLFDNSYALEVTDKYGKHLLFMADDIGKTLYITYEEAQAKLAEMEDSHD